MSPEIHRKHLVTSCVGVLLVFGGIGVGDASWLKQTLRSVVRSPIAGVYDQYASMNCFSECLGKTELGERNPMTLGGSC